MLIQTLARSAEPKRLTESTTAPSATGAFTRWTTTALGSTTALVIIPLSRSCYFWPTFQSNVLWLAIGCTAQLELTIWSMCHLFRWSQPLNWKCPSNCSFPHPSRRKWFKPRPRRRSKSRSNLKKTILQKFYRLGRFTILLLGQSWETTTR